MLVKKSKVEKSENKMDIKSSTITLTFGETAENHVGMQCIGGIAKDGFSLEDLQAAQNKFMEASPDVKCELVDLSSSLPKELKSQSAHVLIIRGGVNVLLSSVSKKPTADDMFLEQSALPADTKAFMYGRVVNKTARYNLCFADEAQEPKYEDGKGRVVAWSEIPITSSLRDQLPLFLGAKAKQLCAEGNYYYDATKCGIGWHGDAERKRVVATRLGASLSLHYHWFYKGSPVGETIELTLHHGDVYVMSEKAVGTDWKKRNIPTLRHAAGASKFVSLPKKKAPKK